jgi:hypothetical protein
MSTAQAAQDDFLFLDLVAGQDANHQLPDLCDAFITAKCAAGANSMKSKSACGADEIYRPVNFVPDEAFAFIRSWRPSYFKRQHITQDVGSMEMASVTNSRAIERVYEPMRCSKPMPPPKRFHRTLWRSLTLRIVQHAKKSALDRAAASSIDASGDGAVASIAK